MCYDKYKVGDTMNDISELKRSIRPHVDNKIMELIPIYLVYLLYQLAFPFHFFWSYLEIGVTYNMMRFVNFKRFYFADIYRFMDHNKEYNYTNFLKRIKIFIFTLLGIIPGIIYHYKYQLVPMILMDPKLKDKKGSECLELSNKMMMGNKLESFLLDFSFIFYHILAIFTLGFLEIYIKPYQLAARTKLLYEIKNSYLGEVPSFMLESDAIYTPVTIIRRKKLSMPKININEEGKFVAKFCMQCGKQLPPNSLTCLYCGYIYDPEKKDS